MRSKQRDSGIEPDSFVGDRGRFERSTTPTYLTTETPASSTDDERFAIGRRGRRERRFRRVRRIRVRATNSDGANVRSSRRSIDRRRSKTGNVRIRTSKRIRTTVLRRSTLKRFRNDVAKRTCVRSTIRRFEFCGTNSTNSDRALRAPNFVDVRFRKTRGRRIETIDATTNAACSVRRSEARRFASPREADRL